MPIFFPFFTAFIRDAFVCVRAFSPLKPKPFQIQTNAIRYVYPPFFVIPLSSPRPGHAPSPIPLSPTPTPRPQTPPRGIMFTAPNLRPPQLTGMGAMSRLPRPAGEECARHRYTPNGHHTRRYRRRRRRGYRRRYSNRAPPLQERMTAGRGEVAKV